MKIIICCDGTNNSFQSDLTNVARLSLIAVNNAQTQSVYYDAGVGTGTTHYKVKFLGSVYRAGHLAFGLGLIRNVTESYLQIMQCYNPGDEIYLFGSGRGACAVRVLAGLLQNYGLLKRGNETLVEMIVDHFRNTKALAEAEVVKAKHSVACPIHFMGIWDSVSSVGWICNKEQFPNTTTMPEVSIIRHAMALDERRAKFRSNRITAANNQDLKQIWFTGVHCDVGGGCPEEESGLAKVALQWVLNEAQTAGLLVDEVARQKYLFGPVTKPDIFAKPHKSLTTTCWRNIPAGDTVCSSVQIRIVAGQPPKNQNWPAAQSQIHWSRFGT